MSLIKKNIHNITDELKQNNSQTNREIRLVAVSKGQGQEKILEALNAGHNIFGENYVQEAIDKQKGLTNAGLIELLIRAMLFGVGLLLLRNKRLGFRVRDEFDNLEKYQKLLSK